MKTALIWVGAIVLGCFALQIVLGLGALITSACWAGAKALWPRRNLQIA
jgi:hypothetical protein